MNSEGLSRSVVLVPKIWRSTWTCIGTLIDMPNEIPESAVIKESHPPSAKGCGGPHKLHPTHFGSGQDAGDTFEGC